MKKKYKVAFQGIEGAYSHEALLELSGKYDLDAEAMPSLNFTDLFDNIEKSGFGFVPIENSNAGPVSLVIDLLLERNVEIVAEYHFSVKHVLLARKNSSFQKLDKIYSHPQALSQCSRFLEKNNLQAVSFGDTAGSAKYLAEKGEVNEGVIGSEKLEKMYDLKIVKRNIQNRKDNTTRFFLLKKKGLRFENPFDGKNGDVKSALLFVARNIPGALYKSLGGFATNSVNLTKIESRPTGNKGFTYFFYIEFEGDLRNDNVKNALKELRFFSEKIKLLGTFAKL